MDVGFCLAALDEALATYGRPEIFNTEGSQFTSAAFTGWLASADIRISMDGRARWMDNVFIERLWRSLKYEDVYLKGYADGREARAGIAGWVAFYNGRRPHQALAGRTPMAVWREGVSGTLAGNAVDMTLRGTEPPKGRQSIWGLRPCARWHLLIKLRLSVLNLHEAHYIGGAHSAQGQPRGNDEVVSASREALFCGHFTASASMWAVEKCARP